MWAAVWISALAWSSQLGCSKTPALVSGTPSSYTTSAFPLLFLTLFVLALSACAEFSPFLNAVSPRCRAQLCSAVAPLELTVTTSLSSQRPLWSCSLTPASTLTPESSALSNLFCRDNYLTVIHSHSSFLLLGQVILIIVLWTTSN